MRKKSKKGKNNSSDRKLNEFIESNSDGVELYRSYGVKKKVRVWNAAYNYAFEKFLLIFLFAFDLMIIGMGAVLVFTLGGMLIPTFIVTVFLTIFLIHIVKIPISRFVFLGRLRRVCKKHGCIYTPQRNFFASLAWCSIDKSDFTLKVGELTYYVKYATPKKPRTSYTFLSPTEMKHTRHARKSIFALIRQPKDKTKHFSIAFPSAAEGSNSKKIILLSPMPRQIFAANSKGIVIPTGSGEASFGYTVYSTGGLIKDIHSVLSGIPAEK